MRVELVEIHTQLIKTPTTWLDEDNIEDDKLVRWVVHNMFIGIQS